jgi:hypothetical protein
MSTRRGKRRVFGILEVDDGACVFDNSAKEALERLFSVDCLVLTMATDLGSGFAN